MWITNIQQSFLINVADLTEINKVDMKAQSLPNRPASGGDTNFCIAFGKNGNRINTVVFETEVLRDYAWVSLVDRLIGNNNCDDFASGLTLQTMENPEPDA